MMDGESGDDERDELTRAKVKDIDQYKADRVTRLIPEIGDAYGNERFVISKGHPIVRQARVTTSTANTARMLKTDIE